MQKSVVAQVVASIVVFAGIISAGFFNTWAELGLERQDPHFTISMIVTVLGLLVLALLAIQEWLMNRKERKERRARERQERTIERDAEVWFESEDTHHPDNRHLMST